MKVVMRPTDSLVPYARNPRQNDAAVDALAGSIAEFGFRQPIVVDGQGIIIVGHTRWKAAQKLGLAKVPVHVAEGLTPAQIKAYRIADNRIQDIATWDDELLGLELQDLVGEGFDMDLLGFDEEELAGLMDGEPKDGLTDPDDVPERQWRRPRPLQYPRHRRADLHAH
jgi:ParB-like chromosome segregation protein Spo0J